MAAFSWATQLPGVTDSNMHVALAAGAVGLMTILAVAANVALGKGKEAVTPAPKLSIKGLFEQLTEFIGSMTDTVVGPEGRPYVPMFATIFFFILINNIFGLVPSLGTASENINTGLAVGLFVFVVYNAFGIKEHGLGYVKHFMGPIWWLAPLILVVELFSHLVRPLSLSIRLRANMLADHSVLGIFTDLVPYVVPVPFYILGLFVSCMQAFIFTVLTMIYVSMALSHDH
ncbi:MAG: F0F1 ATP synthase subunit A [Bdellovibrionaceae bacterium]|nr:F0F1 ATP synthase subunit A [Pseudobdellovibrionaceae bacterium]